jgi:hypothetical protein
LEGWAIPDTLRLDLPAWFASVPDTHGVHSGTIALAQATPAHRAEWAVTEDRLQLQFATAFGFRHIWFAGMAPVGQAPWEQLVEFDRLNGRLFARQVECPSAAS